MIIGSSMPTTPRVGMAVATAIIAKIVTSSPRLKAQARLSAPKKRCRVNSRTKSRKKAAGVAELKPSREPWISIPP